MDVVVLVPSGVTAFEVLGPYGVFHRASGATVRLIGDRSGRVRCHGTKVPLLAETSYLYVDPTGIADVLVVPGGLGIRGRVHDRALLDWLRAAHETASWTIGVSTGAVLLSAAGVLDGQEATTHWLATDLLEQQGAHAVAERLVRSGDVLTATGAVSGLEAALYVVERERSEAEATAIRGQLDDDLTSWLSSNKPVGADVLAGLAGVRSGTSDQAPFGSPTADRALRRRRRRGRPRGPRWSPRSGRIRTTGTSSR